MYLIPGYVSHYEENGNIFVTSSLYRNTVKLSEPAIQEEFKELVQKCGCSELSTSLTQFLHEQEMLINEQELKQTISKLYEMMDDTLLITMMPTEGCNFRCPYCYEDHIPDTMRRVTLDRILDYISNQASFYKSINISWFGGEPTLCRDAILEVSDVVKARQKETPFLYTSSMTTNGYLLNLEHFLEYYNAGITTYQITLDGWSHDKTRPHVSGRGTLEQILDNLKSISSLPAKKYPYSIIIRHNILSADEDYSWYDYLKQLFGNDKRFSVLIRPVCDWGGESVQSMNLLEEGASDILVHKHIAYLRKIDLQCKNLENSLFSNVCNASYPNSMIFRPNGNIEKCTICLGHPKNKIGYVDPEQGVTLDKAAARMWGHNSLKSECFCCSNILSCLNAGCKRIQLLGEKKEDSCPFRKVHTLG